MDDRFSLIKIITAPLGFFALSLLIVEGFLTIVLIFSDLEPSEKFWGMLVGAFLFLVVVAGVWWLVKNCPTNLTFGESAHLEARKMAIWGTEQNPGEKSVIEAEILTNST
jgi:hypothetical protein